MEALIQAIQRTRIDGKAWGYSRGRLFLLVDSRARPYVCYGPPDETTIYWDKD